jgi:hypothetical protein
MLNIVCTSKPGDGLLRYSYEHCNYINSIQIKCQLVIITNPKFTNQDYIKAIDEQYTSNNYIIFNDDYIPSGNETTLIMGRSMLTLAHKDKTNYTIDQLLTLRMLFSNDLISVYNENHPKDYPKALNYFKPKSVYDLCD